MSKFAATVAAAAATSVDMTQAQAGASTDIKPPEAGPGVARLVSYIELGKHERAYQGKAKTVARVLLVFELLGKRHPPLDIDGVKYPRLVTIEETLSLNEKARFFKLFGQMNYGGAHRHMAEMLLKPFAVTVIHRKYKKRDGSEGTAVELFDKATGAYTLRAPRTPIVDQETGEETGQFAPINVAAATSPERLFLWDNPDMEQWNSLFIDGEYPERKDATGKVVAAARSKNVYQGRIMSAKNFGGSPIEALLLANGKPLDVPAPETGDEPDDGDDEQPTQPAAKPAATQTAKPVTNPADPLAGIA